MQKNKTKQKNEGYERDKIRRMEHTGQFQLTRETEKRTVMKRSKTTTKMKSLVFRTAGR